MPSHHQEPPFPSGKDYGVEQIQRLGPPANRIGEKIIESQPRIAGRYLIEHRPAIHLRWMKLKTGIVMTLLQARRMVRDVNIVAAPKARLLVEVVYDLVCPWCYLGIRRLFRTMHRRPDLTFELYWRPFLLNPDMPRAGMARSDYVIRKFGGEERARRLYGSITEIGSGEGVEFRFDRIRRTPSSVDAHRLVRWSAPYGRSSEVAEALFAAHFADGHDIGDHAILRAVASGAGLDPAAAGHFLRSDEDVDAVHADNLRAHRLGINGVPCFVVAGRHAIAGAQEPEVIERLLDVAAVDAPDSW